MRAFLLKVMNSQMDRLLIRGSIKDKEILITHQTLETGETWNKVKQLIQVAHREASEEQTPPSQTPPNSSNVSTSTHRQEQDQNDSNLNNIPLTPKNNNNETPPTTARSNSNANDQLHIEFDFAQSDNKIHKQSKSNNHSPPVHTNQENTMLINVFRETVNDFDQFLDQFLDCLIWIAYVFCYLIERNQTRCAIGH